MALKLNGKDDSLKRADFLRLAATGGISAAEAQSAIDSLITRFAAGLDDVAMSQFEDLDEVGTTRIEQMLEICRGRLNQFA